MKKILNILLFLSLLLVLNVHADAGPPSFPEIKIEISNIEGAMCIDQDNNHKELLPYGATYNARQDLQEETFYLVTINDEYDACHVNARDVVAKTKDFEILEEEKTEVNVQALTLDNVTVYSGPATIFNKVGTIPKGVKLKPEYEYNHYWLYVSYKGIKGFISRYKDKVVLEMVPVDGEDISMITINKTPIYKTSDGNFKDSNILGYIPSNTEITNYWLSTDKGGESPGYYYVTYNGISGFIVSNSKVDSYAHNCEGYTIKSKKEANLYKTVDFDDNGISSEKIGSIEANKDYEVKYCGVVPNSIYYIPSLNGWVIENYDDPYLIVTDQDGKIVDDSEDTDTNTSDEPQKDDSKDVPQKVDVKENKGISNGELIIICVGVGILVALTILITILLINKRKNENNTSE